MKQKKFYVCNAVGVPGYNKDTVIYTDEEVNSNFSEIDATDLQKEITAQKTSGLTLIQAVQSGKPFRRARDGIFYCDKEFWCVLDKTDSKSRAVFSGRDILATDWEIKES